MPNNAIIQNIGFDVVSARPTIITKREISIFLIIMLPSNFNKILIKSQHQSASFFNYFRKNPPSTQYHPNKDYPYPSNCSTNGLPILYVNHRQNLRLLW